MKPLKKTRARMARRKASHEAMLTSMSTPPAGAFTAPGSENRHKGAAAGRTKTKRR